MKEVLCLHLEIFGWQGASLDLYIYYIHVWVGGHAANPGTPDVQSTEMRLRRDYFCSQNEYSDSVSLKVV